MNRVGLMATLLAAVDLLPPVLARAPYIGWIVCVLSAWYCFCLLILGDGSGWRYLRIGLVGICFIGIALFFFHEAVSL